MSGLFDVLEGVGPAPAPFVVITHPCFPRGKGRPRSRIIQGRPKPPLFRALPPFVHFYTDPKTVYYEAAITKRAAIAMGNRPPTEMPLAVRLFFIMPIAKSWTNRDRDAALAGTKEATTAIDIDNCCKAVLDALNEVVWRDDRQIVRLLAEKQYGEHPGIIAEIFELR